MKITAPHWTVTVAVVVLSNLIHTAPTRADGCPTPSFAAARTFDAGAGPVYVAVGDFNGDGKTDLAVANYHSANVSVLLGKGDGSFQSATNYSAGTNPNSVSVGDFNGD